MAKKLTLEDLKVQSFVTALTEAEARLIVGGVSTPGDPGNCNSLVGCPTRTYRSQCCEPSNLTDAGCGCSSSYTTICTDCDSTANTIVCSSTMLGCGNGCNLDPTSPGLTGC
jgi:hypothetical protein